MALKFYPAYIDGLSQAPVDEWQQGYQAASDDFWDNTSTVRTIQAQTSVGSTVYDNEEVQVTSILNPKTGKELGDDWRELVHKVYLDDTNYTGKYYIFAGKTWIATNTNKREGSVRTSIVRRCNKTLKWVDNAGVLHQWACALSTDFNYIQPDYGTMGVPEIKADAVVYVQQNEETKAIPYNQRFLFDGKPYILVQTNPHIVDTYLVLYINATQLQEGDDIVNDIANAEGLVLIDGVSIVPDTAKILSDDTKTFSVYFYEGGAKTSHTFSTAVIQGFAGSYQLSTIDGNTFSVTNIKRSAIPLVIRCTDNENGEYKDLSITLGGEY